MPPEQVSRNETSAEHTERWPLLKKRPRGPFRIRISRVSIPYYDANGDFVGRSQRRLNIYRRDPATGLRVTRFSVPLGRRSR